jgi:hypothetical protein
LAPGEGNFSEKERFALSMPAFSKWHFFILQ